MNVAIVDNNLPLLRILEVLFRGEGHQAAVFHDAVQAIDFLRKRSLDVLIVDYVMPELNGTKLSERLKRNRLCPCQLIISSGHLYQTNRDELTRLGVRDVLAKSFDLDTVLLDVAGSE